MGWWWIVAQVVVALSATARFELKNIRCVNVDVEEHVASLEPVDGIWLRGCTVHQHLSFLDGVDGG